MISIEELIREVSSLKMSSEQLSTMFSHAGRDLQERTNAIAALVRGSRTGMDAVSSLSVASKSLLNAAASITTLGRTCDECVAQLSK